MTEKPLEKWLYLGLPIGFIALAVWDACFSGALRSPTVKSHFEFLAAIVFLNGIHIIFTFYMIVNSRDGQEWFRNVFFSKSGGSNRFYLFLLPILIFVSAASFSSWEPPEELFFLGSDSNALLWLLFPIFHSFTQSMGLSLNYNYRGLKEEKNVLRRSSIKKEKNLYKAFMFLILFSCLVVGKHGFLSKELLNQNLAKALCCSFLILLIPLTLYSLRTCERSSSNEKLIFQLRYFLYPLSFVSVYGFVGIGAVHGIEYFFVWRKIKSNDTSRIARRKRVEWAVLLLLFLVCLMNPSTGVFSLDLHLRSWLLENFSVIATISLLVDVVVTLVHYYLDHELFKMKNIHSLKWMAPLIRMKN